MSVLLVRCFLTTTLYKPDFFMVSPDKDDINVGTGLVGAPACGDVMKLQIKVDDEGKIVDSCFKTFGCGSAIASSVV